MENNQRKASLAFIGSICLSDIPKEVIKCPANGKKYLNIAVMELTEPSQYGDTHFISCAPKKDERKEGVRYVVGNLKRWVPAVEHISQEEINNAPTLTDENDDLPF